MTNNSEKYSDKSLNEFKNIIEEKLETIQEEIDIIQGNQKDQKQHVANSDVDFNENSKHFQHQAKDKQHIRRLQGEVTELKDALKRIENKSYGISEQTGELIRKERLMAMPTARFDILQK